MTLSSPIADLLTRIRNAIRAEHRFVDIPWSKFKENIVKVLREHHFVNHYVVRQASNGGTIRVYLKYRNRRSAIQGLKLISKPGQRHYVSHLKIPSVYGGQGIAIISTPKGVINGAQARENGVGGELICYVW